MGKLNLRKAIEKGLHEISDKYDLDMDNIKELLAISKNEFDLLNNSFAIGYIQGVKATKAEMKKKGALI